MPKQNRARARLKKNWMEGIKKAMNERNLNEGELEDRKQWSLGVGQQKNVLNQIYTNIHDNNFSRCHLLLFHGNGQVSVRHRFMFMDEASIIHDTSNRRTI
jgi:hypothetical protein